MRAKILIDLAKLEEDEIFANTLEESLKFIELIKTTQEVAKELEEK